MARIINPNKKNNTKIEKFSFKKLDVGEEQIVSFDDVPSFLPPLEEAVEQNDSHAHKQKKEESIFDANERTALLEKIDQLTSDVIRLQMELEKKEETHRLELEKAKQEGIEEGKKEAIETFQQEASEEMEALKAQMIRSITQLDETKHIFEQTLSQLEEELIDTALLLAKKVIIKEVEKDSAQIAVEIARFLLENIKESSDVTLRVNPEDFAFISSQFKETLIKIEPDEAIQKGGVVLLSGVENIDGTILTRYKQALHFLQKES